MIKSNLAVIMAEHGLNISELSRKTGVSRNTLASLYNNMAKGVQFETLDAICTHLDISVGELLIHYVFDYEIKNYYRDGNFFYLKTHLKFRNKTLFDEIELYVQIEERLFDEPDAPITEMLITIFYPLQFDKEFSKIPRSLYSTLENEIVSKVLEEYHILDDHFDLTIVTDIKDE